MNIPLKKYKASVTMVRTGEIEEFSFQAMDIDSAERILYSVYGNDYIWKVNYFNEIKSIVQIKIEHYCTN
tara:strand:+ start:758 stop:967 length:210 start_codon:yes stop_codon:yes gene_type:complete